MADTEARHDMAGQTDGQTEGVVGGVATKSRGEGSGDYIATTYSSGARHVIHATHPNQRGETARVTSSDTSLITTVSQLYSDNCCR